MSQKCQKATFVLGCPPQPADCSNWPVRQFEIGERSHDLQPYLDSCGSYAIGDPISWKRNSRNARVPSKSSTRRSSDSDRSADTMSKCVPYRSLASVIGI